MKTALITGAHGQDAFFLTKFLLTKNYKLILTTRTKKKDYLQYLKKAFKNYLKEEDQIQLIEIDYLSQEKVDNLVGEFKPHEIYNLTGHSNVITSFKSPNLVKNEPTIIFNNFINAIKKNKTESRFFQASTSEIFKDTGDRRLNEESQTKGTTPYSMGKLKAHNELRATRDKTGLFLVSGIMFNHESLIRSNDYLFGYVANNIKKIKNGEVDKFYISNLNTVRDWGYSAEFVEAMWLSLNADKPDDYVISTGQSFSVEEILYTGFKTAGLDYKDYTSEVFNQNRSYDVEKKYSDPSKIHKNLSWKASLNGKDIIKKIVFNELDKNKSNISTYKKIPETKMINVYQPDINSNDKKYVISALNNSNLSGASPEVKEFENKFASKFNFKYCLAVNNGTAALHLALMALGIQRDDEVIIPSLSFIATANAVSYVGAKPVIVDVNPNTFQISVEEIENNITSKTKAIIPVHLYGNCPNLSKISKLARKYNLSVLHDSAEALGTEYKGKSSGSYKDVSIYSFYPNKLITTGEGGMLVTSNKSVYDMAKKIRSQGVKKNSDEYIHDILGYNYRMNSLSASMGRSQLDRVDNLLDRKKEIFSRYKEKLEPFGIEFIKTEKDTNNSYWLIVVIFKSHKINIDILREYLYANNIETKKIFYPLERQTMYKNSKNNKNSYDVYSRSLCLPSSPDLSDNQVDFISEKLIKYLINV